MKKHGCDPIWDVISNKQQQQHKTQQNVDQIFDKWLDIKQYQQYINKQRKQKLIFLEINAIHVELTVSVDIHDYKKYFIWPWVSKSGLIDTWLQQSTFWGQVSWYGQLDRCLDCIRTVRGPQRYRNKTICIFIVFFFFWMTAFFSAKKIAYTKTMFTPKMYWLF
jgi:hypothetical protein